MEFTRGATFNRGLREWRGSNYRRIAAAADKGVLKMRCMIENTDQLIRAIERMGRMQRVLESFRRDILPQNPKNFAIFAEGPLDEIRKLQMEIDEYVTRLEGVDAAS